MSNKLIFGTVAILTLVALFSCSDFSRVTDPALRDDITKTKSSSSIATSDIYSSSSNSPSSSSGNSNSNAALSSSQTAPVNISSSSSLSINTTSSSQIQSSSSLQSSSSSLNPITPVYSSSSSALVTILQVTNPATLNAVTTSSVVLPSANSNSQGSVITTSLTPDVCTIQGLSIYPVRDKESNANAGICTINYSQEAYGEYPSASTNISFRVDGTTTNAGKTYRTVKIGTQIWLGENVNQSALYTWASAMGISSNYNTQAWGGSDANVQGLCPQGWRVANNADWETLIDFAGGANVAGYKLKAKSTLWNGNAGSDELGFTALPYGSSYWDGYNYDVRTGSTLFWTATEYANSDAYTVVIGVSSQVSFSVGHFKKLCQQSIRCIKQ